MGILLAAFERLITNYPDEQMSTRSEDYYKGTVFEGTIPFIPIPPDEVERMRENTKQAVKRMQEIGGWDVKPYGSTSFSDYSSPSAGKTVTLPTQKEMERMFEAKYGKPFASLRPRYPPGVTTNDNSTHYLDENNVEYTYSSYDQWQKKESAAKNQYFSPLLGTYVR
jgi:hypothetical protein